VLFLCIFPEASKADGLPISPGDVKGLLWATWTFLPLSKRCSPDSPV